MTLVTTTNRSGALRTLTTAVTASLRSPGGQRALRAAVVLAREVVVEIARDPAARQGVGRLTRGMVGTTAPIPARAARSTLVRGAQRPARGDCEGWQAYHRDQRHR